MEVVWEDMDHHSSASCKRNDRLMLKRIRGGWQGHFCHKMDSTQMEPPCWKVKDPSRICLQYSMRKVPASRVLRSSMLDGVLLMIRLSMPLFHSCIKLRFEGRRARLLMAQPILYYSYVHYSFPRARVIKIFLWRTYVLRNARRTEAINRSLSALVAVVPEGRASAVGR